MISEATHLPVIDGPLRHFSGSVEIGAPQSAVWRLWAEPRRWVEWDPEIRAVLFTGPVQAGATGRLRPAAGAPCKFEIVWADRTGGYGFVTRLPFARLRIEREWLGGGGTGVQHEVYFEGPLALLWARILGPRLQRGLAGALGNLKRIAEAAH